ncbi:MAG: hypothetical protein N838_15170 [Thiohalocapsa sp. PB-PSB1]|nr:MAG: hypothetical protein N838_15170 [Thiohalocapsa sp. PB-PSB1]
MAGEFPRIIVIRHRPLTAAGISNSLVPDWPVHTAFGAD